MSAQKLEPDYAKPLHVLVVEDDEADAYLIHKTLAANRRVARVTKARDGGEALALLSLGEIAPDLALVDLHMPRMGGLSLLVQLGCRDAPRFPVVVLTSSKAGSDAARSKLRGADKFFTKPDSLDDLQQLIDGVISNV